MHAPRIPFTSIPLDSLFSESDLLKKILQLYKEYEQIIGQEDFKELKTLSYQFNGLADEVLNELKALSYFEKVFQKSFDWKEKQKKKKFKSLKGNESEQAQKIKEALLQFLLKTYPEQEARQKYEDLLSGKSLLNTTEELFTAASKQNFDPLKINFPALKTNFALAEYLGHFYDNLKTEYFKTQVVPDPKALDQAKNLAKLLQTVYKDGVMEIFEGLTAKIAISEFQEIVDKYLLKIESLFRIAGSFLSAYLSSIPNISDGKIRKKYFQSALSISEHFNRLLLFNAYLSYSKAEMVGQDAAKWYGHEKRRTNTRTLPSEIPQGKKISIAKLKSDPKLKDGDFLQIEGRVDQIEIIDDPAPPKFSTLVTLTDPDGEDNVRLRAHMFGLEDNGLKVGAYCKVNGFLRTNKAWLNSGERGMDIDRISLTKLRKESWEDDVTYRMKKYYYLYKDEMNMGFSLSTKN